MFFHNVIRRGDDFLSAVVRRSSSSTGDDTVKIPPFAALVFALTMLVFFMFIFFMSYSLGHVMPTLCMIEAPDTAAYVPVNNVSGEPQPPAYTEDDEEDGVPKPIEEINLVRNRPYTTSIRATLRHLRARGGFWAPIRGLSLYLVMGVARNFLIGIVSIGSRNPFAIALAAIIAEVLLAHVHMAWIHAVISEPSPKRWYSRIPSPSYRTWKKIAPAVALWSVTTQIVYILPVLATGVGAIGHLQDPEYQPGKREIYFTMGQLFGGLLLTLALFVLLEIPAMVTMVRVAASMLSEEEETIVPFDRTFGGKVAPSIIGGEGKIDLVEAWKSFPWASRKRLLTLCVKVIAIAMVFWMMFTLVIILEAHLLFGAEAFGEMMKGIHGITRGSG